MIDLKSVDFRKFREGTYKDLERGINANQEKQKEMRSNLLCMNLPPKNWFGMNGSFENGYHCIIQIAKLSLNSFELFCDKTLKSITRTNSVQCENRVKKFYDETNNKTNMLNISIKSEYLDLKLEEIDLQNDLIWAKQLQKDIERDERELIKEQLREEKLLEKEKERAEKRITKLQYDYNKLCGKSKKDIVKMHEIETELEKLNLTVKQNNYALTHNRAGYVYVVSNSDMKDGQYKIGITRRTVEERMKELGSGASHSFSMNVHGYVYSEDCFELESALHKYFDKQRVNQCNPRKEWFKTTLDEISKAFWSVGGIKIDLTNTIDEEYTYSKQILEV